MYRLEHRRRQAGEAGIRRDEPTQRIGALPDDIKSAAQVLVALGRARPLLQIARSEPANERIGVRELLISWDSTRISRCHASRSSACRVRLTSVSSTS